MEYHAAELLGVEVPPDFRFPLLVKILDAQETLSVQVHPPAAVAARLGGEPKTEMWYVAEAAPAAKIYTGLRRGVTRETFERKVADGTVAECIHEHSVRSGDAMFLRSGRVHAIGAGNVIFEIQQNSDTTYRVFDWNRAGLDGKPRELHVEHSLASIDFDDFEPALVGTAERETGGLRTKTLVTDPLFSLVSYATTEPIKWNVEPAGRLRIVGVLTGGVRINSRVGALHLRAGDFCLFPAVGETAAVETLPETLFLVAAWPGEGTNAGGV